MFQQYFGQFLEDEATGEISENRDTMPSIAEDIPRGLLLKAALNTMSSANKPQKTFIALLVSALVAIIHFLIGNNLLYGLIRA